MEIKTLEQVDAIKLKPLDEMRGLTWVPRQNQQKRNRSICDLPWVAEKSRMMVTIQLRRIINAYLGRSSKPVLNRILRLSNFQLQNSSNSNAVIQIFLCLRDFPFLSQVSPHSSSINICICIYFAFTRFSLANIW